MVERQALANKTNYFSHNGIWVPDNLHPGDIVRCRIGTRQEDGRVAFNWRNALVLGFEYSTETKGYKAIHVARFSYRTELSDEEHRFFIGGDAYRSGHISGMKLPIFLRTNHTDVVPLDRRHVPGRRLERIGHVSPDYLKELVKALAATGAHEDGKGSIYPVQTENSLYIPSVHHMLTRGRGNKGAPSALRPYASMNDFDLAEMSVEFGNTSRQQDGQMVTSEHWDAEALKRQRGRHKKKKVIRQNRIKPDQLEGGLATGEMADNVALDAPEVTLKDIFEKEVTAPLEPEGRLVLKFPDAEPSASAPDLEHLPELFRSRAAPRHTVLPKHLWQGRYVMLNIGNLWHGEAAEEESGAVFRPCIVWKMYRDSVSGEIAGLELHPVSRKQAEQFKIKFPVYPLRTKVAAPSYLIADCLIRIPMDASYFHENSTANFYELPPYKIEKFQEKKRVIERYDVPVRVLGLQEPPENWEEVFLDPAPSFQQFQKWAKERRIRFDGALTDTIQGSRAAKRAGRDLDM